MKHIWEVSPRGKRTKYYKCMRCKKTISATSLKEANSISPKCKDGE